MIIEKTELNDGTKVLLAPVSGSRTGTIVVTFRAGARYESWETDGISHFLEHMFFKGTESLDAEGVSREFTRIGAMLNAFTSRSFTTYFAKVPSRHLDRAIELWAELLKRGVLRRDEFERERNVVIQEYGTVMDNPESRIANIELPRTHFKGTSMEHSIIGTVEALKSMTVEQMLAYRNEHYSFGNAFLCVAGDLDEGHVMEMLNGQFSKAPVGGEVIKFPRIDYRKPTRGSLKAITIPSKKDLAYLGFLVTLPGSHHPLFPATNLLLSLLYPSRTSLLYKELIQTGLTNGIVSLTEQFSDISTLGFEASTRPEKMKELLDRTLIALHRFSSRSMTEEQLILARRQVLGNLVIGCEDPMWLALRNVDLSILHESPFSTDDWISSLKGVTLEDLELAKEIALDEIEATIVAFGNMKEDWTYDFPEGTWNR